MKSLGAGSASFSNQRGRFSGLSPCPVKVLFSAGYTRQFIHTLPVKNPGF
jgi:hypothetical protein